MAKKKYKPDITACLGGKHEEWGSIYASMLTSKEYQALTNGAKQMYTVCRVHAHTEQCRRNVYKFKMQLMSDAGLDNFNEVEEAFNLPEGVFVLPAKHSALYGYNKASASIFLKQLEEAGFIKNITPDTKKIMRDGFYKQNLYAFSSEWRSKKYKVNSAV